jgi:hypothetical protein
VAQHALDIPAHGGDVGQPSLELGLAQVVRHGVGERAGIMAQHTSQLAELVAAPFDRAGQARRERGPQPV